MLALVGIIASAVSAGLTHLLNRLNKKALQEKLSAVRVLAEDAQAALADGVLAPEEVQKLVTDVLELVK